MDAGYVGLGEAAQRVRLDRSALRRVLTAAGVPLYADPRDKRRVLVRLADVERAVAPRLIGAGGGPDAD